MRVQSPPRAPDPAQRRTEGGRPGSLALQGGFAALLALDFAIRSASGDPMTSTAAPALALAVALVGCVGAAVLDRVRATTTALAAIPVLDIVAIGLARLSELGSGAGVLIVLPAFWLALLLGRLGILITLVTSVTLVSVPSVAVLDPSGATMSRAVLLPVVAAFVALAMVASLDWMREQQQDTARHASELRSALQVIEHQRRVANAILDTVDVGLVLLDHEGQYESMNRRHTDFMRLAYPDGHAGRAGQLGFVYAADGDGHLMECQEMPTRRAMLGEEFDDCRIWVGDDDLTRRALSVSARTVRDDEGTFAGAALAYKDVTDLVRALEVKDGFVSSVSHELRTPLTSIRGYLDLLLERDDLPPDVIRQLGVVGRNSERLGRLVADLLHSAQQELGPVHVVRTGGDLAEIITDAVSAAEPVALASGLDLVYDGPAQLVTLVDQCRMRQVVDNLVSNAIKYTPSGGKVEVRLTRDGSQIQLEVSDSGIGIEAADRDLLFSRFFRSRQAEERSIQGVGLGLSITRSIVESHGGRIEVDSEPGCGSTFRVRVPSA